MQQELQWVMQVPHRINLVVLAFMKPLVLLLDHTGAMSLMALTNL